MTDLIYCTEREKNKHPNYAQQCDSFQPNNTDAAQRVPTQTRP